MSQFVWLVGGTTIAAVAVTILAGAPVLGLLVCCAGAIVTAGARTMERADLSPAVGLLYAGFFGEALVGIRESDPGGFASIVFLFSIIWSTDILAYFGGRTFGGPKLAPAISPNKTWSGFVIGTLGGVAGGSIVAWLFGSGSPWLILGLACFLSITGQLGDLFESGFKRRFAFKDSSRVIPGHGGVMDRLDSLVFATMAAYLVSLALFSLSQPGSFGGLGSALLKP